MYVQHEYARFYAVVLQASTVYPPLLQHLPGCPPASSRKPVVTCKTSLSHLPVPFPYTPSACKTTLSPSHLPARVLDLQDTSISCKTTPSHCVFPRSFGLQDHALPVASSRPVPARTPSRLARHQISQDHAVVRCVFPRTPSTCKTNTRSCKKNQNPPHPTPHLQCQPTQ